MTDINEPTCPNCGNEIETNIEPRPVHLLFHECIDCGLTIKPQLEYMDLDELNEKRKEFNEGNEYEEGDEYYLEHLDELPNQEWDWSSV